MNSFSDENAYTFINPHPAIKQQGKVQTRYLIIKLIAINCQLHAKSMFLGLCGMSPVRRFLSNIRFMIKKASIEKGIESR